MDINVIFQLQKGLSRGQLTTQAPDSVCRRHHPHTLSSTQLTTMGQHDVQQEITTFYSCLSVPDLRALASTRFKNLTPFLWAPCWYLLRGTVISPCIQIMTPRKWLEKACTPYHFGSQHYIFTWRPALKGPSQIPRDCRIGSQTGPLSPGSRSSFLTASLLELQVVTTYNTLKFQGVLFNLTRTYDTFHMYGSKPSGSRRYWGSSSKKNIHLKINITPTEENTVHQWVVL